MINSRSVRNSLLNIEAVFSIHPLGYISNKRVGRGVQGEYLIALRNIRNSVFRSEVISRATLEHSYIY